MENKDLMPNGFVKDRITDEKIISLLQGFRDNVERQKIGLELIRDGRDPQSNKRIKGLKINLSNLSIDAHFVLIQLDGVFVGTTNYMGLAYFWNYEYRHYLRDKPKSILISVHDALLKSGLDVSGKSEKHLSIINQIVN